MNLTASPVRKAVIAEIDKRIKEGEENYVTTVKQIDYVLYDKIVRMREEASEAKASALTLIVNKILGGSPSGTKTL